MIYGINRQCGHVTEIVKWPNSVSAKTVARWAESRSVSAFLDASTSRTIHYASRGWKGPDSRSMDLSLKEAAEIIEENSTS